MTSPYAPPQRPSRPPLPPVRTPGVLTWFHVYSGLSAAAYLLFAIGGAGMVAFRTNLVDQENPEEFWLIYGLFLVALGIVFFGAYTYAFFLPREPWAWVYGIVLIALGLTSCGCLPFCIPLLIFWLKPETQAYFGRTPAERPAIR